MHNYTKKNVRERILTLLRNQTKEERSIKSLAIAGKFFEMSAFKEAKIILFYASFDGEVETFDMMREAQKLGKTIGLPRIIEGSRKIIPTAVLSLEDDLETGPYGIKQPKMDRIRIAEDSIDMVVVPGVSFDKQNNRLGRGGGYYDRFLESLPPSAVTVGLAFDFQIVGTLSSQEKHDVSVSCVLTN